MENVHIQFKIEIFINFESVLHLDGTVAHLNPDDEPRQARRIHGVLLFVPIGILEEEAYIPRVVEVLKEMNRKSMLEIHLQFLFICI
jgi:hypothetical protein